MKLKSVIVVICVLPALSFGNTCFRAASSVPHEIPKYLYLENLVETENSDVLKVHTCQKI